VEDRRLGGPHRGKGGVQGEPRSRRPAPPSVVWTATSPRPPTARLRVSPSQSRPAAARRSPQDRAPRLRIRRRRSTWREWRWPRRGIRRPGRSRRLRILAVRRRGRRERARRPRPALSCVRPRSGRRAAGRRAASSPVPHRTRTGRSALRSACTGAASTQDSACRGRRARAGRYPDRRHS
jgi:hypothetical protein